MFDVTLMVLIILSVILVMLESVPSIQERYGDILWVLEWSVTIFFSLEYIARIISLKKPKHYILSFYGIIDLLSVIPTYLGLVLGGVQSLMVIRTLRLLRIFRVLKLVKFVREASVLGDALKASRHKISVFFLFVLAIDIIAGTVMYLIEPSSAGFTSIPRSIYWAIVTMTTVGYGDIAPVTVLGQLFASLLMIMGYVIIAVPTGIVSAKLSQMPMRSNTQACLNCGKEGHTDDARYCRFCGEDIYPERSDES